MSHVDVEDALVETKGELCSFLDLFPLGPSSASTNCDSMQGRLFFRVGPYESSKTLASLNRPSVYFFSPQLLQQLDAGCSYMWSM